MDFQLKNKKVFRYFFISIEKIKLDFHDKILSSDIFQKNDVIKDALKT